MPQDFRRSLSRSHRIRGNPRVEFWIILQPLEVKVERNLKHYWAVESSQSVYFFRDGLSNRKYQIFVSEGLKC